MSCTVAACERPAAGRGMCGAHLARWRRHGDPLAGRVERGGALAFLAEHIHDDTDECVIWPYATRGGGYGAVKVGGRMYPVTVLACLQHYGPPTGPDMQAAHGPCHNPLCFNWRHLSWKTPQANTADKRRDGTHLVGQDIGNSKLTPAQVDEIRRRYAAGDTTQAELGEAYGVTYRNVGYIVNGRTWRGAR